MGRYRIAGIAALCLLPILGHADNTTLENRIEVVHEFFGSMPTGVTVSQTGRIFVNYPRWGDPVPFTVAEIVNGREVPYPNAEINKFHWDRAADCFVSVQSVVVDPRDRLWVLDTGAPMLGPSVPHGPKLVCIDLKTNHIVKKFVFDRKVVPPATYLNDIRFDLRRGKEGAAFITDSGATGPSGILVVDLATGTTWRRLADHPSVQPTPDFTPVVDGQPLMTRRRNEKPKPLRMKADGIAISSDGKTLYYCPLASRKLFSVSTDALWDQSKTDADVAATVKDLGDKGSGADGLEQDDKGRIYITEYEKRAVERRMPDGGYQPVVHDNRLYWPDTLSVAKNGYLYGTANQLELQKNYHYGRDLRHKPYLLWRVRIDAGPVLLK